jgi:NADH:ubiquinone oxidoreductase subunit
MRPAMGFWSKTFTWWNGATWGTQVWTSRFGDEVGKDDAGNVYYQAKKDPGRRWVIYNGSNDGSRVPPGWQAWLKRTIDELPEKALPAVRKFQKEPTGNLTGTMAAFRPDGALGSGKIRPASTGDYEPWIPE